VIGPGTTIKGELYGTGSLDLAGTLDGPCQVSGHCIVRASGRIAGDVTATSVVVEGEVTGTTVVAEKVEIGTSGRVRANIRARVIAIAEGAYFAGEVHMEGREGQSAPIAFKEKRKGEPVA
jgi:cytoskeletal protein CcmA (bactofilin family)